MTFTDEDLMAFADGQIDDAKRKQIQEAIDRDPEIARQVAAHRALKTAVHKSFEPVLEEPVPDRLIAAARAASQKSKRPGAGSRPSSSNVVPLRGRGIPTRQRPRWVALAASFILGALALQLVTYLRNQPETDAQIIGSGALQRALSTQLASEQTNSPVRIGISFLSRSGNYCRTFHLHELSGLACNEQGTWNLQVVARSESGAHAGYKPAASDTPPAIVEAVNATVSGEPLDAKSEAEARAQKWQHAK